MDIEGLGEQRVRQLVELGLVRDLADIYSIDWDVLRPLDGWGETSITNLQQAIEASKEQPLARLLVGLNIRHLGPAGAEALAAARGHLDQILDADVDTLAGVEGVGPVIAKALHEWLSEPANRDVIERLRAAGVNFQGPEVVDVPQTLTGRAVVVTGTPRGLQPRRGGGGHQAPRREVSWQRVEEDDGGRGGGGAGRLEAEQGHRARGPRPRRSRLHPPARDGRATGYVTSKHQVKLRSDGVPGPSADFHTTAVTQFCPAGNAANERPSPGAKNTWF